VLTAAPDSRWAGEAHVALGRQAEYARSYEEALEHLHHPSVALTDPDRRAQAALAASDALAMLDRFDAARESARRALELAEEPKRKLDSQRAVERTAILGRPALPIEVDAVLEGKDRTDLKPIKNADGQSEAVERLVCTPESGRIAWLEFFSADCPYCKKAYPSQVALANRLLDLGAEVYWIGIGDSETDTKEQARLHLEDHLKQYPRPGVVAMDADLKATFAAFAGQGTPWTVLIDETGTVRYADTYNEQRVRDKLKRMLGGDVFAD
jgi:tetratricopeptide (TPR) repeat protein